MKVIYQQIISFVTLLIITLVIISVSFIQSTKRLVYSNTWNQLEGYADVLQKNGWDRIGNFFRPNQNYILEAQDILSSQDVNFIIYNSENLPIFPSNVGAIPSISGDKWNQLLNGKTIRDPKAPKKAIPKDRQHIEQTAIYKPYFYRNKLFCVIVVTSSVQGVQKNIQNIESNLLLAIIISSAVAIVIIYLLSSFQSRRINRMRKATREISEGNYDVIIPVSKKTKDELNSLSQDFNNMTQNLKEANIEIERQEERRRQFMADAAHEMRTPLTTINGLLEGLAYDAIPEEEKGKSIDLMRKETTRLIKLVNENLDYERIRANQITLNKTSFDSTEALKNVAFQLEKKAAEAGDTIKYESAGSEEKIPVYADYDRFVEIVINIANNSIQFTKDGTITLKNERGYKETKIMISDTGIGMTEEQVKNIWDRYYKADPSRKNTKYGESGLGLSIVQQLVKLHGGEIKVESEVDKGTTFTLVFPDGEEEKND
ncbi:sensor histidine kinase [Xylocopilactobacillus apis]|uniref:histidine kinase n=1 Tax=Xylocopilactobacillus apis TaxID=2932183 RepID=A0AAU9D1V1_9LACO|nr:HAMP domain-containing sensor histidine kinase [Xylocopilactobacillus apis]BDR56456.1 two-component sensor histidine kinase [Xylocopilactobacillus apis]